MQNNLDKISEILEDDEVFFPGEFDAEQTDLLKDLYLSLDTIREDSARESKLNTRRFVISTIISVFALIAAVIAAVAALIPLL